MKKSSAFTALSIASVLTAVSMLFAVSSASAAKEDAIKEAMKTFHKAPKGVDPVCKKAGDGTASADELKKLVACYKEMAAAKPPKGDMSSWKEKTGKLLAAATDLQKGKEGAAAKYKEAVNCKACHSVHKPD
ncbi:MAG: hypothetical protein FJ404_17185 [Verrucomicrobia bacterium]|nr:hypothetical protein [Verrucomicrobiota bacterium]